MKFTQDDTLKCKGAAILMMLFHHMYLDEDRYAGYTIDFAPFSPDGVMNVAGFFKICVGMYVFLSAFGLTLSYRKRNGSDSKFVVYRYLKMMFTFWYIYVVVIVLSFVLNKDWNVSHIYGTGKLTTPWYMLIDALGLAELFGSPTFDSTWWYMSLAIVIIMLIPLLNWLYDKWQGAFLLMLSILLPVAMGLEVVHLTRWLFCMALGVVFARINFLGRIKEKLAKRKLFEKIIVFFCMCIGLYALFRLRQGPLEWEFIEIWDSVIPVYVITLLYLFVNAVPIVGTVLHLFGRYSTVMFLTHTFIRDYWFREYVYVFENAWANYLIIVIDALAAAMALTSLKRIVRFEKVETCVLAKVEKYIK